MTDIRPQIAQLHFTDSAHPSEVVNHIIQDWKHSDTSCIIHYMYYANYVAIHKNPALLHSYQQSQYILVDGIGMQIYFKITTGKSIANLNGTDMSPLFFEKLYQNQIPISLYGTTAPNIKRCYDKLIQQYGESFVHFYQDGYHPLSLQHIPDRSALFVGLGSPRQERWVSDHWEEICKKKLLVFTVGGYFDFLSGFYVRAPQWVRTIKMEWLWRTILHPGRHYHKRLRDMTILFLPLLHKLKGYRRYLKFIQL